MAGCSPKVLDQWVRQFLILPKDYLKGLLQIQICKFKTNSNMSLLDESHLLDLTDNLSKHLLYQDSKDLEQFRVLNTAIKLPSFKSRLVFTRDTVLITVSEVCLEARRNTCEGYCSSTVLIPTMARNNKRENIYPSTLPFLFFVSTNPSLSPILKAFLYRDQAHFPALVLLLPNINNTNKGTSVLP